MAIIAMKARSALEQWTGFTMLLSDSTGCREYSCELIRAGRVQKKTVVALKSGFERV